MKRLETETRRGLPRSGREKGAGKKYRLSKYRRKTENAKERQRMKRFNEAFENLREKLPNKELLEGSAEHGEKDTKVGKTLHCSSVNIGFPFYK